MEGGLIGVRVYVDDEVNILLVVKGHDVDVTVVGNVETQGESEFY